jgi:biotin carboxyl carrier protein
MDLVFWHKSKEIKISLEAKAPHFFEARIDGKSQAVRVEFLGADELLLNIDGRVFNIIIQSDASACSVFVNEKFFRVEKKSSGAAIEAGRGKARKRDIRTSMPGRIVRILAVAGESISERQPVLVLEAMKMQNEIKSPQAGRITRLALNAGDYVEAGALLFSVE